jgi:hypothetical protein
VFEFDVTAEATEISSPLKKTIRAWVVQVHSTPARAAGC